MTQTYIQDSCGVPHETTLYNLNVLNQLAMACIDNEKLNDISCKFSDILSEVETTGSYSIRKPDSYTIEKPLAPTHKSKGFLLSSSSSTGRCRSFSDDKCFDKRRVLTTAQSSGRIPHTPLGFAHAFHGYSGVLMMLIQELSAKEKP